MHIRLYQTKMSYNPHPAHQPPHAAKAGSSCWSHFIGQLVSGCKFPRFPRAEILAFSQQPGSPKVKQLLEMAPKVHNKYKRNCEYFSEMLILLYLLTLKGCATTSEYFAALSMDVLEQLLTYRLIVVTGLYQHNILADLYDWINNWLSLLVPALLLTLGNSRDNYPNRVKGREKGHSTKTILTVIRSINKREMASESENGLLVIFQCLLISKIRSHLSSQCLFQFDSLMRQVYSEEKFLLVYQGKGRLSHLPNRQKQKCDLFKELLANNILHISELIPARVNELSWEIFQLQLEIPDKQEGSQSQYLKLKKTKTTSEMQQWVVDSFGTGIKPTPVKISFSTLLTKMKAMEIYRFLSLLQIYGSSPNIEVLNEYILDQKVLQIFTKFLLGENLAEFLVSACKPKQRQNRQQLCLVATFRNQKLIKILQKLMNSVNEIDGFEQKKLLIEEFKTKLLCVSGEHSQEATTGHLGMES